MNDDQATLDQFGGVVGLFPLPGLVFFPHAIQPLHVFEPRYRQLTADALTGDRLMALVLLRPGWEDDYDHQPAIHQVACLGRIVADQSLPDGRTNLVLRGLARIRIVAEPPTKKLYRQARVEVLTDCETDCVDELMALRTDLAELVLPRVKSGPVRDQLQELFQGERPLGHLCDVLAFALPLPPEAKQELLEARNVPDRARKLMTAFRAVVEGGGTPTGAGLGKRFPPDFSAN